MSQRLFVILTIILLTRLTAAQTVDNNSSCKEAYNLIMALRFEDAQSILDHESHINSENVMVDYLENQIDFLKVTLSEDEELFNKLDNIIDERTERIKELPDENPAKKYFLGNINLQKAINNLRFMNYTTGLWQVNKSYRLLTQNQEEHPDYFPNEITLGVLHIMIGIVPDSYNWILNLISMRGTVEQGRQELKQSLIKCETNPDFYHLTNEVLFYITMIDLSLSADPEYSKYVVSKTKPLANENLLMAYLTTNIYMKNGENDSAISVLNNIDTTISFFPFYYLDYLKGECQLRKLNVDGAINHYINFIQNFTGSNYMKDAVLKTSWSYLIKNDSASYKISMDKIPSTGKTDVDADKVAQSIAENNTKQNIELIKARLLFDGGYYLKADSVINNINVSNLSQIEKVELLYRKARTSEKLDNQNTATKYYIKTIESGKSLQEYFAGNSALKLGNYYEKQFDTTNAILYYNICLDLDFEQYRNSIKGKAKQGLNRLKVK